MAGLVPAIHALIARRCQETWMPGTSPGMTFAERPGPKAKGRQIAPPPSSSHFRKKLTSGWSSPSGRMRAWRYRRRRTNWSRRQSD
ncbi:hypothetical protein CWO91_37105 [Bradyrhizobium genosp. SA-3]|nr:hypothetical protein CWO91_37105 [Bradyrhizobium genosp. SA-3]